MVDYITPDDLAPFTTIDPDRAKQMIADAVAMAILAAPCINSDEFRADPVKMAALKAILRGSILRWNDAGSGAVTTQTAGPFGQTIDTSQPRRAMFWPSEIDQLRGLCAASGSGDAFTVDMTGLVPEPANPLTDSTVVNARKGDEPIGEWSDEDPNLWGEEPA